MQSDSTFPEILALMMQGEGRKFARRAWDDKKNFISSRLEGSDGDIVSVPYVYLGNPEDEKTRLPWTPGQHDMFASDYYEVANG